MRLMVHVRAIAVAGVLACALVASLPVGAAPVDAGSAASRESVALDLSPGRAERHRGETGHASAGDDGSATLRVSVAIVALGSLWLVLVARRTHLRGALEGGGMLGGDGLRGDMLRSGGPRHAADGR